jgi:hypothetical protein
MGGGASRQLGGGGLAVDPWTAAELGNLPVLRREIDMGSVRVAEVNRITGESLLMVCAALLVPAPPASTRLMFSRIDRPRV